jgi:RNA polymerase sigma factor (sigma-70 family)
MYADDKQLISRLRQGDDTALDSIYVKYRPRLLAAATSFRVDAHLAEDVLHDVFVAFSRRMKTLDLDIKTNLYAYLLTGVANAIRDRFRRRQRRRQPPPFTDVTHKVSPDPQQQAIRDEQSEWASEMMAHLPREQRQVVSLRINSGLKFQEIARVQGVSPSTVRGRYRYGIDKLRECVV